MAIVYVNGNQVATFHAKPEPEDAVWHRDIGEAFWAGVIAGRASKSEDDIEVRDLPDDD